MRIRRIGFWLLRIGAAVIIDLKNHTGKYGNRRQLLLCVIDKCMSGEQTGVNGLDCLLNAGRYVNPLLLRTFGFGFRIQKVACRFPVVIEFWCLLWHFQAFFNRFSNAVSIVANSSSWMVRGSMTYKSSSILAMIGGSLYRIIFSRALGDTPLTCTATHNVGS